MHALRRVSASSGAAAPLGCATLFSIYPFAFLTLGARGCENILHHFCDWQPCFRFKLIPIRIKSDNSQLSHRLFFVLLIYQSALLAPIGAIEERDNLGASATIGRAECGCGRAVVVTPLSTTHATASAQNASAATSVKPFTVVGALPSTRYNGVTL